MKIKALLQGSALQERYIFQAAKKLRLFADAVQSQHLLV